ncbi:hypothetical protein, partial [Streptomyces sp. NPDC021212]|uniref:hypothetical protein n=1 Tax=Streptomyces sp. NPDC021212 TaxID=3365118 RepID=UPI0037A814AB
MPAGTGAAAVPPGGRLVVSGGAVAGVCVGAWLVVRAAPDRGLLALRCPFVCGVVLGQGLLR